jgi:hypothetical protein
MGIGRTRFKVEALVEGACLLIFGMHKHCSDTGDLCGLGSPLQRILEQSLARYPYPALAYPQRVGRG